MAQKEELDLNGRREGGPKEGTSVSKGRGARMPNRERMAGGPDIWSRAGPSTPGQHSADRFPFSLSLLGRDWGSPGNSRQVGALTSPRSFVCAVEPAGFALQSRRNGGVRIDPG